MYDHFFPMEGHLDTQAKGLWVGGLPSAAQVAMSNQSTHVWCFLCLMFLLSKERFGQLKCHLLVWFPDALIALPSSAKQEWHWHMCNKFFPFVIFKVQGFGDSLVAQWLGLRVFTAGVQVRSLTGELWSCKPCGVAQIKCKNLRNLAPSHSETTLAHQFNDVVTKCFIF